MRVFRLLNPEAVISSGRYTPKCLLAKYTLRAGCTTNW